MSWHENTMCALAIVPTRRSYDTGRVVLAHLAVINGKTVETTDWLTNPGVPVPEWVTDTYGITTAQAQADGLDAARVLREITGALAGQMAIGVPLIAWNAVPLLTLLDRDCRRHDVPTLTDLLGGECRAVIDPAVLDRHVDPLRPGWRRLVDVAWHHGLEAYVTDGPDREALTAARTAYQIAAKYAGVAAMSVWELHDAQAAWRREQEHVHADNLRRQGRDADLDASWPLIPFIPSEPTEATYGN